MTNEDQIFAVLTDIRDAQRQALANQERALTAQELAIARQAAHLARARTMTTRFRLLLASAVLAQLAASPAWAQPLVFTPQAGLSGPSHGDGTLKLFTGNARAFHVRSLGRSKSDGSFTLEQTVAFEGKPGQARAWAIHQVSPLHYRGTLSDAAGVVTGHTSGSRLQLSYRVKGPLVMHQTLELQPDGKTIDNVGRITLFGVPVGSLHETIRRED